MNRIFLAFECGQWGAKTAEYLTPASTIIKQPIAGDNIEAVTDAAYAAADTILVLLCAETAMRAVAISKTQIKHKIVVIRCGHVIADVLTDIEMQNVKIIPDIGAPPLSHYSSPQSALHKIERQLRAAIGLPMPKTPHRADAVLWIFPH